MNNNILAGVITLVILAAVVLCCILITDNGEMKYADTNPCTPAKVSDR